MKKVSVLITTYKRPKLVVEAIMSCVHQTYSPYEIIIGDDSPDEQTYLEVEKIKKTCSIDIRHIHNLPSLGQTKNVNMLFDEAAGDTAVLLHDDDLLLPAALEKLIHVFNTDSSIDIAYGKQYIINQEGEIDYPASKSYNDDFYRESKYAGQILTPLEAGMGQQFPNNGYMVRCEIIRKFKFRNYILDNFIGNGCEYDFGLQLGLQGYKMCFVDEYLAKYRITDVSMSKSSTDDSAYQAFKILSSISVDTARSKEIQARRMHEKAPIAIVQAVDIGKKKEALDIYFSKWYAGKKLTFNGIKRIIYILLKFR